MHTITFDPRQGVRVVLVGTGGTGSLLLTYLVRLDQALRALGGAGLHVTAYDDDLVSQTNLTRQNFAPADVGRPKAVVLVERCNLYAGLNWQAVPRRLGRGDLTQGTHIVITCVDSAQSRRAVLEVLEERRNVQYWLDCGNDARTGQVILGQLREGPGRLPHVLDRDPTMRAGEDDDSPSCSAAEALTRQHLFINPQIALQAAQVLGELLLSAQTAYCGAFVNLGEQVGVVRLPVPEGQPVPAKGQRPAPLLVAPKARRKRSPRKKPAPVVQA